MAPWPATHGTPRSSRLSTYRAAEEFARAQLELETLRILTATYLRHHVYPPGTPRDPLEADLRTILTVLHHTAHPREWLRKVFGGDARTLKLSREAVPLALTLLARASESDPKDPHTWLTRGDDAQWRTRARSAARLQFGAKDVFFLLESEPVPALPPSFPLELGEKSFPLPQVRTPGLELKASDGIPVTTPHGLALPLPETIRIEDDQFVLARNGALGAWCLLPAEATGATLVLNGLKLPEGVSASDALRLSTLNRSFEWKQTGSETAEVDLTGKVTLGWYEVFLISIKPEYRDREIRLRTVSVRLEL